MSMRSDFLGELQNDEPLFDAHRQIDVPPLREAQLREVVSRPAALLGARFETDRLADDIARRRGGGIQQGRRRAAAPFLSARRHVEEKDPTWDGVLRLPAQAIELGRVLVDRANAFVAAHPNSEDTFGVFSP